MHTSKENPLALTMVWIISAFVLLSAVGYLIKSLNNHAGRIIDSGNSSPQTLTSAAHANPDQAIEQHLQPVGKVVIDVNKKTPTTDNKTSVASNEVVATVCSNCHSAAMANIVGAPEMHSTASWAPRMEKGFDAVLSNAINGLNKTMPPRGGKADLTDEQLAEAIRFMSSPAN